VENEDKIKIGDKEYSVDSLSDQQKYFLLQVRLLNKKINDANIELAQLRTAMNSFTDSLVKDIGETDSELTSDSKQQEEV
jgi:hypothetical protein|tara:strand:- start:1292 stop:1531 length:240 start_codon:yes stop_codon:yes gene_type:complete